MKEKIIAVLKKQQGEYCRSAELSGKGRSHMWVRAEALEAAIRAIEQIEEDAPASGRYLPSRHPGRPHQD